VKKTTLRYLENLLNAPSPSGYEDKARAIWRTELAKSADEVYGDTHGNSIAVLNKKGAPRVMLAGHIDEIGFQVNYISPEGYVHFRPIGGFDTQIIPGRRVVIHTEKGPVKGVIGKKAIHLMKPEDRKRVPEFSDLWIDTGISDGKKVKKLIDIGDPVTYAEGFEHLAENVYVSRGVDDRIGSFVVGEVIRYLKGKNVKSSVYSVATVQEEVGLRGAKTSAYGIDPDVAFAVDVTFANTPDSNKKQTGEIELGKGPVVTRGANFNPKLHKLIKKVAKAQKIKIQLDAAPGGTGTDANAIQITRAGVAAALISIPNRYMHTPVELFNMRDVEAAIKLIAETIRVLDGTCDFTV
jgi:endoglucanase